LQSPAAFHEGLSGIYSSLRLFLCQGHLVHRVCYRYSRYLEQRQEIQAYAEHTWLLQPTIDAPVLDRNRQQSLELDRAREQLATLRSAFGIADRETVKIVRKICSAGDLKKIWTATPEEALRRLRGDDLVERRAVVLSVTYIVRLRDFYNPEIYKAAHYLHDKLVIVWQHGRTKSAKVYFYYTEGGRPPAYEDPVILLRDAAVLYNNRLCPRDLSEVFGVRANMANRIRLNFEFEDL